MSYRYNRASGFSLTELGIACLIVAILAGSAVGMSVGAIQQSAQATVIKAGQSVLESTILQAAGRLDTNPANVLADPANRANLVNVVRQTLGSRNDGTLSNGGTFDCNGAGCNMTIPGAAGGGIITVNYGVNANGNVTIDALNPAASIPKYGVLNGELVQN